MMRVAVVTGGSTPERDVALAGAGQVVQALRGRGHDVIVIDTVTGLLSAEDESRLLTPQVGQTPPTLLDLETLAEREDPATLLAIRDLREADVAFLVLHGKQGEGGEIQALLDLARIPYTGAGPLGSALAMDKDVSKRLLRSAGVATPDWQMWPVADEAALALPVVVKPSKAGSTVGLTVVEHAEHLTTAVALARRYDDEVMVEAFVGGREFTVGILGQRALAVGEIVPAHAIFDYECKYTPGLTEEIFPAPISRALAAELQRLSLSAHHTLKLRDFSRVDFRLDAAGTPQCLELNTLPGLTATSLLPQSAAAAGIAFDELCVAICHGALQRSRAEQAGGS